MPDESPHESAIDETTADGPTGTISPQQYRRLKDAVFGEAFEDLVFSDRRYFVIGSYDDGEKRRLLLVRDRLDARGDGVYAFLMDDVPEAWEFWTTKFKVLASRADHVVGVFEHSHGGHEWEAGYVAHERFRRKSHVLKRAYSTEEREREAFDGMFAHFLERMAELGRVYLWTDEDELLEQVARIP